MTAATSRVTVFAVEDTTAQICWAGLPAGEVALSAGGARAVFEVPAGGRPGAVVLEGLEPDTSHQLVLEAGGQRTVLRRFRTLAPPPGQLLARFATVSDLHLGERAFGLLPRIRESPDLAPEDAYPVGCARAAVAEAVAWGAERLVAKGDLTWSGRPRQWDLVADVLGASSVPVHAILGNHDVRAGGVDGRAALAPHGIVVATEPEAVDLPGIRLVLGHTADLDHERGAVGAEQREGLAHLVAGAGADGGAFVALHHFPDRLSFPARYPVGIPRAEAEALLRALAQANRRTFLSFGHSHRNRRGVRHGLTMTEVGSTKDFPGVWAGYAVHEGGIRQVVRRVSDPRCMDWTDRTRAVLGGFWGLWSPGRRSWRCFSHPWPAHP